MLPKSCSGLKQALFVGLSLTVIVFEGCSDKVKTDIAAYKTLDEGLVNTNVLIGNYSDVALLDLEYKVADPRSTYKAQVWYPKAKMIQNFSKEIYTYMAGLKAELKKEAGLRIDDDIETFREKDKNSVIRLFNKQGRGQELYDRLKKYRDNLLAVDSGLNKEFRDDLLITTPAFDSTRQKSDFTSTFFDDIPVIAALALLSKFENNVRIAENKTITFCSYQIAYHEPVYDRYVGFAVISSNCVKPGEKAEITAGIGSFSKTAQPVITVNGRNVPLDGDGIAYYSFKSSSKPGKHFVLVEIAYTNTDGEKRTLTKRVEYKVVDCK